jgi:adenylate cyclase
MEADETWTLAQLKALRGELFDPKLAHYGGRIVKTTGDGVLAEFASAVDAVEHALDVQRALTSRNREIAEDRRMVLRIGINIGDVVVDDDDIFGDGVNVAARLEGLAEPAGICISADVHRQVEGKVAATFEDRGEQTLKNIARPVRIYFVGAAAPEITPARFEDEPLQLPDKPSIAVLPFENMSADPEQEYFSDGITEDIITELTKISGLFVIARHSAFTYKGKSVTLKQVGRELGVRYVLEGSVRKAADRLRITAQLIDAATDHHLWAERYDRDLADIFAVQDEVARHVAEALAVTLKPGESEQLAHAPTDNMSAYDLYMRLRARSWPPTHENIASARSAFSTVMELDSAFAGGFAGKALAHAMAVLFGRSEDRVGDTMAAMDLARQAVELDPSFARAHSALGLAYSAAERSEDAIASARRAVELQPGDTDSHAWLARCLMWAGEGDEACVEARTAYRLDPQFIEGPYLNLLARVSLIAGQYEDTIEAYERNDARGGPQGPERPALWAAALAHLGRLEEAGEQLRRLQRNFPNVTLATAGEIHGTMSDQEKQSLIDGLRKAGLPE